MRLLSILVLSFCLAGVCVAQESDATSTAIKARSNLVMVPVFVSTNHGQPVFELKAVYQYRYSDLLRVFSILMRDGWLKETDLMGLQPDKIADIKAFAESLRKMFNDAEEIPESS